MSYEPKNVPQESIDSANSHAANCSECEKLPGGVGCVEYFKILLDGAKAARQKREGLIQ